MDNYSKEYCIKMHQKLWKKMYEIIKSETQNFTEDEKDQYIYEMEDSFIYGIKRQALEKLNQEENELPEDIYKSYRYNSCFACLYAFSERNSCQGCPFYWNVTKKTKDDDCICCNAQYGKLENLEFETIDELLDLVKEIAELPVREDV